MYCKNNNGKEPFTNSPESLAVERHYYRLEKISRKDIHVIKEFLKVFNPISEKSINEIISSIISPVLLRQISSNDKYKAELDAYRINAIEDYHSKIESAFIPILKQLKSGNMDFINEFNSAISFYDFIAHQSFRTKKIKAALTAEIKALLPDYSLNNVWVFITIATSLNFGANLFITRNKQVIDLIEAPTGHNFITSDQPVINIASNFINSFQDLESIVLYYPITPNRALILSNKDVKHGLVGQITISQINQLNTEMKQASHFQTFAKYPNEL